MPVPSDHAPSFTSCVIGYIHCTPSVDSAKLAALLVIVGLQDSMIPLCNISCTSARNTDITQGIHDNHNISQSSKSIKSTSALPSSKCNRLLCGRKKISKRSWSISEHLYPIPLSSKDQIFCNWKPAHPMLCMHAKNNSWGFKCLAINSCRKQHSASWEACKSQITKSSFLRGKNCGLDGSTLQVTLSS